MQQRYYYLLTFLIAQLFFISLYAGESDYKIAMADTTVEFVLPDSVICPGDSALLTLKVPGTTEAQVNLIDPDGTGTAWSLINGIRAVYIKKSGQYTITWFEVRKSGVLVFRKDTSISFNLTHSFPTATIIGGGDFCKGEAIIPLVVKFTGKAPWTLDYNLNGGSSITIMSNADSIVLSDSNEVDIQLTYLSDSSCEHSISGRGYISVSKNTPLAINGKTAFCPEESAIFSTTASPNFKYQWFIPEGAEAINSTDLKAYLIAVKWVLPGEHKIELNVENLSTGCKLDPIAQIITVHKPPIVKNNYDTLVCFGDGNSALISPSIVKENIIYWPEHTITNRSLEVFSEGIFKYKETTPFGCSKSGEIRVIEKCFPEIFVADAFTPNNDNINDVLEIHGVYFNLYLEIYSANGELVHFMSQDSEPWDGTYNGYLAKNGVYYWKAKFTDKTGEDHYSAQGNVTLIR